MRPTRFRFSTAPAPGPASSSTPGLPPKPPPPSGIVAALQYTGIPASWIRRPKLPGRNWLIFWGVVGSLSYLYVDDRRKCRQIKEEYAAKVRHLAEVPLGSMELPRKVQVYACKWPGDDEYDRSMKYFKRYVKPVLVAAAIDYETKNGNQYGAISELIRDKAIDYRRELVGLAPAPSPWKPPSLSDDKEKQHQRWLEGGTILIGRHTFKEYMRGLRDGWTESLEKKDAEEMLANRLAEDGHFDEPEETPIVGSLDDEPASSDPTPAPTPPKSQFLPSATAPRPSSLFAPVPRSTPPPPPPPVTPSSPASVPEYMTRVPDSIPTQPPLLLVHYENRMGVLSFPMMIVDFFNERKFVREGCEAAYKIVMSSSRPIIPPTSTTPSPEDDTASSMSDPVPEADSSSGSTVSFPVPTPVLGLAGTDGDLSFAEDTEAMFGNSFADLPKITNKARKEYYKELPNKLKLARDLARGEREPTKDEVAYPPKTEVELREQRMTKEKKWTSDESAWSWLRKDVGVAWDPRFASALRVFVDVEPEVKSENLGDESANATISGAESAKSS
ncbi:hypothetical protein DL93DRAFT_2057528 [Clavulina sp. PMI_390]|nr:hypothetical protein DL93DRAFT_2057528 [Clavulina sp. PMI_390]